MKSNKLKKMLVSMTIMLISSTALFSNDSESKPVVANKSSKTGSVQQSLKTGEINKGSKRHLNSWTPFFLKYKNAEPSLTTFLDLNIGVGILYFSGIKGNLEPVPFLTSLRAVKLDKPVSGHLSYNRTPLVESVIGMSIFNWWKIGLAYQNQSGVTVSTLARKLHTTFTNGNNPSGELRAALCLDAIMFKTYFMFPYALAWKNVFAEPYLALAVGPGWQTWSRIVFTLDEASYVMPLRQKISANCIFTVDLGFKLRKSIENYMLSFTCGCKYNQWGQARSMGKLRDQGIFSGFSTAYGGNGSRTALSNPLRIKTVYQFAPYIGAQLNF